MKPLVLMFDICAFLLAAVLTGVVLARIVGAL